MRTACMLWGNVKGGIGKSAYVYIAWASASDGTGFTMIFDPALKYIAIKSTTEPIAAPVVGDFAGLWRKYVGENGEPGATPQKGTDYFDGDDGYTPYIQGGYWYINGANTGVIAAGSNGRGITSIALTNTVGLVKTYTITYTDATTSTYDVTDGADGEGGGGGGTVTVITEGENIEVYYDFKDAIPFTYTCPMALRFLEVEHEGNAPALSVALNTDMAKYQDLVITPDGTGLVIVKGKVATAFDWPVFIDFDHAGEETYKCPYPLKFLVMEHEQVNAPTLSVALNTNMAKYQVLTITTDAPGLVSLIGILL